MLMYVLSIHRTKNGRVNIYLFLLELHAMVTRCCLPLKITFSIYIDP